MKEIILKIEEVSTSNKNRYDNYDGFLIATNKYIYLCLIDNEEQCCEEFGYLTTPDDYNSFINSELISYEILNISEDEQKLNLNTSNGLLQFSAYNDHNGFYHHDIIIKKFDLNLNLDNIYDVNHYLTSSRSF